MWSDQDPRCTRSPAVACKFYLGTHQPQWLERTTTPLFISRRRLAGRKTYPRAQAPWALDSGGFTELKDYGGWSVSPQEYALEVKRIADEVGQMEWAATMDWMCEPVMLAKTGLSVREHQARSVRSFLELRDLEPEIPWIPVLQGWERDDYLRCWLLYQNAGVDLEEQPTVGVGSVCRRQHSDEVLGIFQSLQGLNLHGFGLKMLGLKKSAHLLSSADSMAWSYHARRKPVFCGSTTHINCANCQWYAEKWREGVAAIPGVV